MYRIVAQIGASSTVPSLPIGAIGWDVDTKTLRMGDGTSTPPKVITDKSSGAFDLSNLDITLPDELIEELLMVGSKGWTPTLSLVQSSDRVVMKITDWTGGTGDKPSVNVFVTPTGLSENEQLATNLRGMEGPPSSPPAIFFRINANGELLIEQDDTSLTRPVSAEIDDSGNLLISYGDPEGAVIDLNLGRVSAVNDAGLTQLSLKTKSELLAISAITYKGSMAFCTDAAGGAGPVYARGTDATDWVKLSDDSDI